MSSYLANLIARTVRPVRPSEAVQPRLGPLFGPPAPGPDRPRPLLHRAEEADPNAVRSRTEESIHQTPGRLVPTEPDPVQGSIDAASSAATFPEPRSPRIAASAFPGTTQQHVRPPRIESSHERLDEKGRVEEFGVTAARTSEQSAIHTAKNVDRREVASAIPSDPNSDVVNPKRTDPMPGGAEQGPVIRKRSTRPTENTRPNKQIHGEEPRDTDLRENDAGPASAILRGAMQRYYARDTSRVSNDLVLDQPSQSTHSALGKGNSLKKKFGDASPFAMPRSILRPDRANAVTKSLSPMVPTIEVTIGRIEVRATSADRPVTSAPRVSPAVSLEEYLRRRSERSSR